MPSRESADNAETMRQAARALAHSSRAFPDPDEMYDVLGSLTYTLGAVSQTMGQIGAWHATHADDAVHDEDGSRSGGALDATTVANLLEGAVTALDIVNRVVMDAHSINGHIIWQTAPIPPLEQALRHRSAAVAPEPDGRVEPPASGTGRTLS